MQNTTLSLAQVDAQALVDPLVYAMASRDADIIRLVRDALAQRRGQMAFHPIVTADDDNLVAFHEGLIRLSDEEGRLIPAAHFMPHIEETDLGREIDCLSLELALQHLRQNPTMRLSVNISARSIGDGEWRRTLDRGLEQEGNLGDRLIFEVSETSAMMLSENVIRFMTDMQPKGVGFAIDGFGAGMIAMRHLKSFFFDLVKIDKSFVRGINTDPDNQVLVEALIMIAHQFEMFAVADGVETAEEAAFLQTLKVDCLQGYLFGVPTLTL